MKYFLILFLIVSNLSYSQQSVNISQLLLEDKIYSKDTTKKLFVDRMHKSNQKGFDWRNEKDAKLIYSFGIYGEGVFTIGFRPIGTSSTYWMKSNLASEEWKVIREKIKSIVTTNEGKDIKPIIYGGGGYKLDSILMNFNIRNLSTIRQLLEMEEVSVIDPNNSDTNFLLELYKYYGEQNQPGVKFPNENFNPYQDQEGIKEDFLLSEKRVLYKNNELINCDPKSFHRIGRNYFADSSKIYWLNRILLGADLKTFDVKKGLPRDKNHVYSREKIIVGADPKPFGLADSTGKVKYAGFLYLKDTNHVYSRQVIIEEADLKSFELLKIRNEKGVLEGHWWAKDKNHVYYQGHIVKNADPKTIKMLTEDHAVDKNHLIMGRKAIPYDSTSFELFPNGMAKDKNGIYLGGGKTLKNADPLSFTYLNKLYQKDKNSVFYGGEKLLEADPVTFKITSHENYATDKNYAFNRGKVIKEVDIETWEWLSYDYSKDKYKVYCQNRIVVGADLATFRVIGQGQTNIGEDKNGKYYYGKFFKKTPKQKND